MISWTWLILAVLIGAIIGLAAGTACAAAGQAERCEECRRRIDSALDTPDKDYQEGHYGL